MVSNSSFEQKLQYLFLFIILFSLQYYDKDRGYQMIGSSYHLFNLGNFHNDQSFLLSLILKKHLKGKLSIFSYPSVLTHDFGTKKNVSLKRLF